MSGFDCLDFSLGANQILTIRGKIDIPRVAFRFSNSTISISGFHTCLRVDLVT